MEVNLAAHIANGWSGHMQEYVNSHNNHVIPAFTYSPAATTTSACQVLYLIHISIQFNLQQSAIGRRPRQADNLHVRSPSNLSVVMWEEFWPQSDLIVNVIRQHPDHSSMIGTICAGVMCTWMFTHTHTPRWSRLLLNPNSNFMCIKYCE